MTLNRRAPLELTVPLLAVSTVNIGTIARAITAPASVSAVGCGGGGWPPVDVPAQGYAVKEGCGLTPLARVDFGAPSVASAGGRRRRGVDGRVRGMVAQPISAAQGCDVGRALSQMSHDDGYGGRSACTRTRGSSFSSGAGQRRTASSTMLSLMASMESASPAWDQHITGAVSFSQASEAQYFAFHPRTAERNREASLSLCAFRG